MSEKIAWKEVFKSWRHENQALWKGGVAGYKKMLQNNLHKTLIPKFLWPSYIWIKVILFPITKRKMFKDQGQLRWNMYNVKGTMGDYYRQWNNFHFTVKARLMYPVIRLAKRMMSKYWLDKVPDEPHYRNLKVLERSYKRAMTEWYQYWMNPRNPERENMVKLQDKLDNYIFSDIFKIMITAATKDTAIFEFVNMFLFVLSQEMHIEYQGVGKIKHVLYQNNSSFDYAYYLIQQTLCKNKEGKYKDIKITMEQIQKAKVKPK